MTQTDVIHRVREAMTLQRSGEHAAAMARYRSVLDEKADQPEALHYLGVLMATEASTSGEGVDLIRASIRLRPDSPEFLINLAGVLLGRTDPASMIEATDALHRAMELAPQNGIAWAHLAELLRRQSRFADAIDAYRNALGLLGAQSDLFVGIGECLSRLGQHDAALYATGRAVELDPGNPVAHCNRGAVLGSLKRHPEAKSAFEQALSIWPEYPEAWENYASACAELGELDVAIPMLEKAVAQRPDNARTLNNLGNAYRQRLRLGEAIAVYRRAVAAEPSFPDAHANLGLALLTVGQLEEGFAEFEWRWHATGGALTKPPLTGVEWKGQPLAGKTLLLYTEQGFGDAVMFVRYATVLARQGARVVIGCPPPLTSLFERVEGVACAHSTYEGLPRWDYHLPLMSAPAAVGTTLETVPAEVPYLSVDDRRRETWVHRLAWLKESGGGQLRVGLVWQGNPRHKDDRNRSIDPALLAPLSEIAGVRLVSLQKSTEGAPSSDGAPSWIAYDAGRHLGDFADTAAAVEQLDLIISVDSAPAHVAGAMGRPVWLLLPWAPDYRWMLGRDDSPWYPTMRLWRQDRRGDWADVITRIKAALESLVSERTQPQRPAASSEPQHDGQGARAPAEPLADLMRRGELALRRGDIQQALGAFEAAARAYPQDAEAHCAAGVALAMSQRQAEAIDAFKRALAINPNHRTAGDNLVSAVAEVSPLDEALATLEAQSRQRPGSACVWTNLGNVYQRADRLDDAVAAHRRAVEVDPSLAVAHANLGMALLTVGQYAEGWQRYEARLSAPEMQPRNLTVPVPRWEGGPLNGRTLLIYSEQGFGDTIQFARYVPLAARHDSQPTDGGKVGGRKISGGKIIVCCEREVAGLIASMDGSPEVRTFDDPRPLPRFDVYCPMLSLPLAMGTTLETIPARTPYFRADPERARHWRARLAGLGEGRKIGLVWKGRRMYDDQRNRSIDPALLTPLAKVSGVRWVSLQVGGSAGAMPPMEAADWTADLRDFADTAALVSELDHVVSIDSAVAHLAGALGRPASVMLITTADWRWLRGRDDSPWYPTMRLYRQTTPGDWADVVRRVAADLSAS